MSNFAGTDDEVASAPPPTAGAPKLSYWHVWTDDDGMTHQTRCDLSAFRTQSMGGAAAQWNDQLAASPATVLITQMPAGWVGDWHENPKPQWIVPVAGRWFVETTDGVRVEMGPGDISFGADQRARPDAAGRQGHRSGTVGAEPAVLMIVQLEDDAWIAARPGAFR